MLTSKAAEAIGKRVLEIARVNSLKPMAVCVVDSRGQTLYFQMEDGNPLFREAIAKGKAMGALGMGVDSAAMVQMFTDRPYFMQALFAGQPGLIPAPGGVLVRDPHSNAVLGAVGVSGDVSDKDEACAVEGIRSAHLSCAAIKDNKPALLKSSKL
jgi:uncharacterized protein GlcG (DUF336 family)